MKRCCTCRETKLKECFSKKASCSDGLQVRCKACFSAYYQRTKEVQKATAARFRQENPDYGKQWAQSNRAKRVQYNRGWRTKNPGYALAQNASYRASKKSSQVDKDPRINALYEIAAWLRLQGDNVHVDHIVPLSKDGGHVYENLQLLSAAENMTKGNK